MASKRETLKNPGGTFYTRRDEGGHFSEHDEKGESLKSDRRVKAKTTAKTGQGDKGDQKVAGKKKAAGPLMPFAIKRLDRLWVRIARTADGLGRLSDAERHKLRITIKKMRYAVEFLAEPFRQLADERAGFVGAAEGVQDRLGELNDLATRQVLLFGGSDGPDRKMRGRHLRAAKRQFGKLRAIGPFWNHYAN